MSTPNFQYPALPMIPGLRHRNGYVLGEWRGSFYIGVRFDNVWRPARIARAGDFKYFD